MTLHVGLGPSSDMAEPPSTGYLDARSDATCARYDSRPHAVQTAAAHAPPAIVLFLVCLSLAFLCSFVRRCFALTLRNTSCTLLRPYPRLVRPLLAPSGRFCAGYLAAALSSLSWRRSTLPSRRTRCGGSCRTLVRDSSTSLAAAAMHLVYRTTTVYTTSPADRKSVV